MNNKTENNYEKFPPKGKKGRPSKRPTLEKLEQDYKELSYEELAQKYEVPLSTLKGWIARARKGIY